MMNRSTLCGFVVLLSILLTSSLSAFAQQNRLWSKANMPLSSTLALWRFDEKNSLEDNSVHNHSLKIRGRDTTVDTKGKFGGALKISEAKEPGDTRQGAVTSNHPSLSPDGAFTIELWFSPNEDFFKNNISFLLDKKSYHYQSELPQANRDYLLLLRKSGSQFIAEAQLGFGKSSEVIRSSEQSLKANEWYHLAFSYNGKGDASLYLNGQSIGSAQFKNRGAITAGGYPLVIGDRFGSVGARFSGAIDEVHLYRDTARYASGEVILDTAFARTAFYRGEQQALLRIGVTNDTFLPLNKAQLQIAVPGLFSRREEISSLDAGRSTFVDLLLPAQWRPGKYDTQITIVDSAQKSLSKIENLSLYIVPRALPGQLPVVMWGALTDSDSIRQIKDIGFTHQLVYPINESTVWYGDTSTPPLGDVAARILRQNLNDMQRLQLGALGMIGPGRYVGYKNLFLRVDRNEKPHAPANANGQHEKVQQFAYDVGVSTAKHYENEPVLEGALIHTEVRDNSKPSFDQVDREAYLQHSGKDIPVEVKDARGVSYRTLQNFPSNRVVADNHPLLEYYRWFWKEGDGWNTLHSRVHDGLKSVPGKKLWTWFDPAMRAPSTYGSGGHVDYINQWTYTYPDPLKIDLAADELFAMAGGQKNQGVMNMTQIIWYRAQTTTPPEKGKETPWEKAAPDTQFVTIAPDHLSEALWLKLSRPLQGIMYHGWGSLGSELGFLHGAYQTTNIETRQRLKQLLHDIVHPLGPTLKQLSEPASDVAFLQSFTSQMFAGRGTYGWGNGWGADSYLIARYAGLNPDIIYEEAIAQKGLGQYKVLFLTHCDVLTESIVAAIKKFQRNGGIVVGDEHLAPVIQPDILMEEMNRGPADQAKAALLKKASELSRELNGFYQPSMRSSNREVIVRQRQFGDSDYIFTINDHRTYGDYVGQYGSVMEKGLPSKSTVTLKRKSGIVYDLIRRQKVLSQIKNSQLQFDVGLEGGGGNVFLVLDEAVGKLQVSSPSFARQSEKISFEIQLKSTSGKLLPAVAPIQLTIRDANGREAEGSGYYGMSNGKLSVNLEIAPNDVKGKWQVEVQENITGQKVLHPFEVQ